MALELKAGLKSLYGIVYDTLGNAVDAQEVVAKTAAEHRIPRCWVFVLGLTESDDKPKGGLA